MGSLSVVTCILTILGGRIECTPSRFAGHTTLGGSDSFTGGQAVT